MADWSRSIRFTLSLAVALGVGCSGEEQPAKAPAAPGSERPTASSPAPPSAAPPSAAPVAPKPETRSQAELVAAGRSVYNANCIACHSMNPAQDGALGPAVAGSSLELLEARILRAEYPEGYEPKRGSRVMVALPHLEPKLPELAAYLESL